jgi:nucleotide-sensitive chloride channel 1A
LWNLIPIDDPVVESNVSNESNTDDNNDDDDDDESDIPITEMRFAPDNINNLDNIFQAMNECQALHPDPQDSFSDGEINFLN